MMMGIKKIKRRDNEILRINQNGANDIVIFNYGTVNI